MAGAAVLFCWAWQLVVVHTLYSGNWTGIFYHGSAFPVPLALRDSTFVHQGNGYDAQFYRMAAHDPLLQHGYAARMDDAALRYRRILIPALASTFEPLGVAAVDAAYLALVVAAIGAGVWFTAAIAQQDGRSPWWGLLFLALPATITSVDRALLDGPLCAAVAAFFYGYRRGWAWAMAGTAAMAALTRETGLLLIAAGAIAALAEKRWRLAAGYWSASLPFSLWAAYVASAAPTAGYGNIIQRPLWGLVARLFERRAVPEWPPLVTLVIQFLDVLSMAGLLAAIALAIWLWTQQRHTTPAIVGLLFAVMAMLLAAPSHLLDPFGYLRPVSPLLLWVSLEGLRRRTCPLLLPLAATGLATLPGPAWSLLRALSSLVKS